MSEKELIIIGAGPAGLKAGAEAERLGIDYIIIEKGEVGQAWRDIRPNMPMLSPCHPQRDWTSLSTDFPIWKLDVKRPFCSALEFVNYLDAFTDHFNLNLDLNTNVDRISRRKDGLFEVTTKNQHRLAKTLLVSTGFFGNPFIPKIPGLAGNGIVSHSHHYMTPEEFAGKRVVIIGGGNSAAEIALELSGFSQVYLMTRNRLQFFSKTKNLCHIRGVSESLLREMIQMELIRHKECVKITKVEDNTVYFNDERVLTDAIICATGYKPVLPVSENLNISKHKRNGFPVVKKNNASQNINTLYFGGPLGYHGSGSMFIHGFIRQIPQAITSIHSYLHH